MADGQWIVKNTFLEVVEEPRSPVAPPPPPTKTAPGQLQDTPCDGSPATVGEGAKPTLLRKIFDSLRGAPGKSAGSPGTKAASVSAAPWSPVAVKQKNTFVHMDEPSPPCGPPVVSAPGFAVFLDALGTGAEQEQPAADEGLPLVVGGAPAEGSPPTSPCSTACAASLGSEGHAEGQCIPCLMQVRWRAGKNTEPCRFGEMCGRCHEPHTEEELHRVQARMRKLKRRGGVASAAVLSAAYRHGTAAPVGAGAGKVAAVTPPARIIEVSI
mmetsp:Transcript_53731/g.155002  ORF Transcript_53731/g.155002 Transcript_53731/m.155002 type:complete len:269 (+) Transcript_53731:95-901(+)